MKSLAPFGLDWAKAEAELADFQALLDQPGALREREDIGPFFRERPDLAALLGGYNPFVIRPDLIAHEFPLFGDYACDLVVGDSRSRQFCLVEFEDASPTSVFAPGRRKGASQGSPRFERGFSQILDWFWVLHDLNHTALVRSRFGAERIGFVGLLVIGRLRDLDPGQRERLFWRSENVVVHSKHVNCVTFDELYAHLAEKISLSKPLD